MVNVLKIIRETNSLSLKDAAEKFGISIQAITKREGHFKQYCSKVLKSYSVLFGIDINDIYELIHFAKQGATYDMVRYEYLRYTRNYPSTCFNQYNLFRLLREYEGMSMKEFSEIVGIDRSDLSYTEIGKKNLSIALIKKYAKALGVKQSQLAYLIECQEAGATPTDILWLYANIKKQNMNVLYGEKISKNILLVLRCGNSLRPKEVAERAGLQLTYIYKLEEGQGTITYNTLKCYAKAFNLSMADIYYLVELEENGAAIQEILDVYLEHLYCNKPLYIAS